MSLDYLIEEAERNIRKSIPGFNSARLHSLAKSRNNEETLEKMLKLIVFTSANIKCQSTVDKFINLLETYRENLDVAEFISKGQYRSNGFGEHFSSTEENNNDFLDLIISYKDKPSLAKKIVEEFFGLSLSVKNSTVKLLIDTYNSDQFRNLMNLPPEIAEGMMTEVRLITDEFDKEYLQMMIDTFDSKLFYKFAAIYNPKITRKIVEEIGQTFRFKKDLLQLVLDAYDSQKFKYLMGYYQPDVGAELADKIGWIVADKKTGPDDGKALINLLIDTFDSQRFKNLVKSVKPEVAKGIAENVARTVLEIPRDSINNYLPELMINIYDSNEFKGLIGNIKQEFIGKIVGEIGLVFYLTKNESVAKILIDKYNSFTFKKLMSEFNSKLFEDIISHVRHIIEDSQDEMITQKSIDLMYSYRDYQESSEDIGRALCQCGKDKNLLEMIMNKYDSQQYRDIVKFLINQYDSKFKEKESIEYIENRITGSIIWHTCGVALGTKSEIHIQKYIDIIDKYKDNEKIIHNLEKWFERMQPDRAEEIDIKSVIDFLYDYKDKPEIISGVTTTALKISDMNKKDSPKKFVGIYGEGFKVISEKYKDRPAIIGMIAENWLDSGWNGIFGNEWHLLDSGISMMHAYAAIYDVIEGRFDPKLFEEFKTYLRSANSEAHAAICRLAEKEKSFLMQEMPETLFPVTVMLAEMGEKYTDKMKKLERYDKKNLSDAWAIARNHPEEIPMKEFYENLQVCFDRGYVGKWAKTIVEGYKKNQDLLRILNSQLAP